MPSARRDSDTGDRNQRRYLRIYIAMCFGIIVGAAGFLVAGASALFLLFVAAGVGLGLVAAEVVWFVTDRSARGLGHLLHSAGNIPYTATYSAEEALVARGDYLGAAAAFRRHAEADPRSVTPLLRLAELSRKHLRDAEEAERCYLEARRRTGQPGLAANQLIDLYRASGNRGRLMAELARFAADHPETDAGRAARKELQSLKETGP
ncbi:MAG: tetratricopeptide repeat protein [Gemmatimonadota bacterium]